MARFILPGVILRRLTSDRYMPAAAAMPSRCRAEIVREREKAAAGLARRMACDFARDLLGARAQAVVEGRTRNGLRTGTTERYLKVLLDEPDLKPGELVEIELARLENGALVGVMP